MGYACAEKTNNKAEIIIQSSTSLIRFKNSRLETLVQSTRSYRPLHYSLALINFNPYKFSFFPRAIVDWNVLPHHSIDLFVVGVCMHLSS